MNEDFCWPYISRSLKVKTPRSLCSLFLRQENPPKSRLKVTLDPQHYINKYWISENMITYSSNGSGRNYTRVYRTALGHLIGIFWTEDRKIQLIVRFTMNAKKKSTEMCANAEHEKTEAILGVSWSTPCVCDPLYPSGFCLQSSKSWHQCSKFCNPRLLFLNFLPRHY